MKTTEVTNSQDIIDSRDIIARIEELEEERQTLKDTIEELEESEELNQAKQDLIDFDESEEGRELAILKALEEEASASPDWQYGETLIRESYFEEYCKDLCEDIGDIPKDLPWYIANHIDWEGVSHEIKMDYITVDFDGVDYLIRG